MMMSISTDVLNIVLLYVRPEQVPNLLLGLGREGRIRRLRYMYKHRLFEIHNCFEVFRLILLINSRVELDGICMNYDDMEKCWSVGINIVKMTNFKIICSKSVIFPIFEPIEHAKHLVLSRLEESCENIMFCNKLEILELYGYWYSKTFNKKIFERSNIHTICVSNTKIVVSDVTSILTCVKLLKLRFYECNFSKYRITHFVHDNLCSIDMRYNTLHNAVDFSKCSRLKKMKIYFRNEVELQSLVLPTCLQYLVLGTCAHLDVISLGWLKEFKNLECIRLVDDGSDELKVGWNLKGLEELTRLKKIDISRSRYAGGYEKIERKILFGREYDMNFSIGVC